MNYWLKVGGYYEEGRNVGLIVSNSVQYSSHVNSSLYYNYHQYYSSTSHSGYMIGRWWSGNSVLGGIFHYDSLVNDTYSNRSSSHKSLV